MINYIYFCSFITERKLRTILTLMDFCANFILCCRMQDRWLLPLKQHTRYTRTCTIISIIVFDNSLSINECSSVTIPRKIKRCRPGSLELNSNCEIEKKKTNNKIETFSGLIGPNYWNPGVNHRVKFDRSDHGYELWPLRRLITM